MAHHGHKIEIKPEFFTLNDKVKKASLLIIAVGLLLTIIGIFTLPHHATDHGSEAAHAAHEVNPWGDNQVNNPAPPPTPEDAGHGKPWYVRVFAVLLTNSYFFLILSVCALFFVGIQYIANAGWATLIKRVPEAIATFIPIAAVLMIVSLLLGKNDLYHWAHYEHEHLNPGDVGYDKLLSSKSWFLNTSFFIGGIVIIPLLWFLFQRKLASLSSAEDAQGGLQSFKSSITWSAAFTFVFAFSFSILSWLVIMSVDAHWFSTIFSIYNFATGFVVTIATIVLFVLWLRSKGFLTLVTDEHVHDLGKFLFAFSIFWTYIWIAQYLLIWYAQIPEEVYYYQVRLMDKWKPFFYINLVMNFLVPFFGLMTRDAKRNPKVLGTVAVIIILGHFNDVWLMIMPGSIGSIAGMGLLEIGSFVLFAGIFLYWVLNRLTKQSLVPVNHPYVEESAHHDVGV
jgi:hypothetical protein